MAQQTNTTNWLIQGSNGQPQMIKLMQQSGKPFNGSLMTSSITGQPVKIIKSSPGDTQQIFTNVSSNQVIRSISTPTKVVTKTIPIHVNKIPSMKTIKLSPNQLQDIKLSQTPTKIEFSSQPFNSTLTTVPVYTTTQTSPVVKNSSPKILSRKRHDHVELEFAPESKRGRKSEKVGKGLRHFSMKVCEKVKLKGTTSYNEVADELVTEFSNSTNNALADQYDQKNIRRRVYDALNVLMAMNIISKEKKEIRWIGLPTNSLQECHQLEIDMKNKLRTILEKEKQLDELILNQIAFKNLAQRNRELEKKFGTPSPNSYIHLPFIVVNTNKKTVINCSISTDKLEYMFQFNDKFEINDDVEILKSIGMLSGLDTGTCTSENLEKIKSFIPQSLWPYLEKIANNCRPQSLDNILEEARASTSSISMLNADDFVEAHLDEENSRQSSSFFEGMSPSLQDFSEEEGDSDISSEGGDIH